jgi:CYTH domain-containing protein
MMTQSFVSKRMRSADDEAHAPKYAHVERERRWLVNSASAALLNMHDPIEIYDRYIVDTRLRLREMRMETGDPVWKLTKKYECADPRARPIVTAYLDAAESRILAILTARTITKTRYRLVCGDHEFSIDRFEGALAGLLLAEIEMDDSAALHILPNPDWAMRDVSDDPRYQGGQLAEYGIPKD